MYIKARTLIVAGLSFYQRYSGLLLAPSCRFYPSCSEYAKQAIVKYGIWKGGLKAMWRLLHCHPFSSRSGYDPLE